MSHTKTYLQKHSVPQPGMTPLQVWAAQNPDLVAVLEDPYHFEDNFLELPYARQIALIDLFNSIVKDNLTSSPSKLKKEFEYMAIEHLQKIQWLTCTYYDEGNSYYPISDDEKKLVRMEAYGTIDRRREHTLSPMYRYFLRTGRRHKFLFREYDLHSSPMWRVFRQFESFRGIEIPVKKYLFKNRINPDALKVMTITDFCDVIYRAFAENENATFARFIDPGYKNRFVMRFMKKNAAQLEQHLIEKGNDPRSARSLCRMMSRYGICDLDSLVITEIKFTRRVLKDLKNKKYDISKFKLGEKIPEDFIDFVFENHDESALLARSKKGHPLSKEKLPRYQVHHTNAVKFSANGEYLAKSNYDENMMLVEERMHSSFFHGLDRIDRNNNLQERYFSRLNVSVPDMALIDGFDISKDAFFCDFANTAYSRNRAKADQENVVNYYQMALLRLDNMDEISCKYHFEYSSIEMDNERNILNKILGKDFPIGKEDLVNISKWLKRNHHPSTPKKQSTLTARKSKGHEH
ncbi:MAG: hypothetical protein J6039_04745 [Alphaproteobacteria bacterium]|nr:hypothetical protein [Alphaproteobacteria bacterium]